MVEGSGNHTTSVRLATILKSIGFQTVYYLDVPSDEHSSQEVAKLRRMIQQLTIKLVVGVNLTRTAAQIHRATNPDSLNTVVAKVPYILIVAGTDANVTLAAENQDQAAKVELVPAIRDCLELVSLSAEMRERVAAFLEEQGI